MVKQVIIIGGHIQALGLARQAWLMEIPVVLFIEDAFSVARFSRSVSKTVVFESISRLQDSLTPFQDTDSLLFPTADQYVEFLADHYADLSQHFVVGIPQLENVYLFGNKRKTYRFATELNVSHPKTWYPDTLEDVERIAKEATYPLVVKPAVMYTFHRLFGKKAFRCDTEIELLSRCQEIRQKIPVSTILIQEFLPGGAQSLYSFGVFAIEGEPKAWVIANRIRQNPMDFGNSTTFAVTCHNPEIEEIARTILHSTKYTGLAEIEFMYDESTKRFCFLEVNTRAWKWHSISEGLGFGFMSELIKYLNGQKGDFIETGNSIAWVDRLTDYTIIAKETLKGRRFLKKSIESYRQKKVSAVWSWKDPLPGLFYLALSPVLFFKRY